MKTNIPSLSFLSLFIAAALLSTGVLKIQQADAQVQSTAIETVTTTSEPVTPLAEPIVATPPSPDLEQVDLSCTESFAGILYDTPSGHLDSGYFVGSESASSSALTVAHAISEQSWTVCHDARGHLHEFRITAQEYAALSVRGTPHKSVMEPADQAALDSFADVTGI